MTVTTLTPVQRIIAVALLAVAVAAAVVRLVTGVPDLLHRGLSASAVFGWVFLGGLVVVASLWVRWIVRLTRGTTARLEIVDHDEVRVEQPGRTVEARGVGPEDVTVRSLLRWHWLQVRSSHVQVNGRSVAADRHVTVLVAGPRSQAEQVAAWARAGLDPVPAS